MRVLDSLEDKNEITLFAALFHDLGKPPTRLEKDGTLLGFPGHERASVGIADHIFDEWEVGSDVRDKVLRIIKTHMFDIRTTISSKSVRKFIASVGKNNIDNWFHVRIADAHSYSRHDGHAKDFIQSFRKLVDKELINMTKEDKDNLPSDSGMIIEGEE
jgi:tRNA nucleotidyltransferase (CCA-adding enzyme)